MDRLSLERVTIYDPGFVAPRVLNVADLQASWAISEVGRLSATATTDDADTARGSAPSILGRWLIYEHPTAGVWSGYIEDAQTDLESGAVELSCVSLVNLLQYRRTGIGFAPQMTTAGGLVLRAIEDSAQDDSVWLAEVKIDESDVVFSYEQNGDAILEVMDRFVQETGEEWLATSDDAGRQSLQWRVRVGSEKIVAQFYEGLGVLGGYVESSIAQLTNDILAVAEDDSYALSTRSVVTDRPSILAYGRRQTTRRYLGIVTESSLISAGTRNLRTSTLPTQLVTISVSHMDTRLDVVREGARVLIGLPSVNAAYRARVLGRSLEVLAGTMTLLCEVESQYGSDSIYIDGAGSATTQNI